MPSYYNRVKGTLEVAKLAQSSDIHLIQSSVQTAISNVITDLFGPSFVLGEAENDLKLIPTALHVDQINENYNEEDQWISFYERYFRQTLMIERSSIESIILNMVNDSNITVTVSAEIRDINFNLLKEASAKLYPTQSDEFQEVEFNFNLHHLGVGRYYFILKPVDISTADLAINGDESDYDTVGYESFLVRYDRNGEYMEGLQASYNGVDYLDSYLLEDQLEYDENDMFADTNFDLYFQQVFSSGNTYLITPGAAIVHGQKVYPIDTHVTIAGPSPLGDRTDLVVLTQEGFLNVIQGTVYEGATRRPNSDTGLKIAYITSYKAQQSEWICPKCHTINSGSTNYCENCGTTVNNKIPLIEQADDNGMTRQRDVLERLRRLEKMITYEQEYNRPTRVKYMCTNDPIINFQVEYAIDGTNNVETTTYNGQTIAIPNSGVESQTHKWSLIDRSKTTYTTRVEKKSAILYAWDLYIPYKKPKKVSNVYYYRLYVADTEGKPLKGIPVDIELKYGKKSVKKAQLTTGSNGYAKWNPYQLTYTKAGNYTMNATYNGKTVSTKLQLIENFDPDTWINVTNGDYESISGNTNNIKINTDKKGNITGVSGLGLNDKSYSKTDKNGQVTKAVIQTAYDTKKGTVTKTYTVTRKSKAITIITGTYQDPSTTTYVNDPNTYTGKDMIGYIDNIDENALVNGSAKIAAFDNGDKDYSTSITMEEQGLTGTENSYIIHDNITQLNSEYAVLNFHYEGGYIHSLTPYVKKFKNIESFKIILFANDLVFNQSENQRISYQKTLDYDSAFPNIYVSPSINIAPISKIDKQGNRILNNYHKFIVDQDIPKGNYSLLVYAKLKEGYSEGAVYIQEYPAMSQGDEYGTSTKVLGSCNPSVIYLETNNITSNAWDLAIEGISNTYKATGILISKPITFGQDYHITSCLIDKNIDSPNGCSAEIQVSNDGGRTWITAKNNFITFGGLGRVFEWKLVLKSNGTDTPSLNFDEKKEYAIKIEISAEDRNTTQYEDWDRCFETPVMDFTAMTQKVFGDNSISQKDFSEWEWARLFMEDEGRLNKIYILTSNGNTDDGPIYTSTRKDYWNKQLFFNQAICDLTLDDFEHTSIDYSNYDPNLEYDEYNYRFKYDTDLAYNTSTGDVLGNYKNVLEFENHPTIDMSHFVKDTQHQDDAYTVQGNNDERTQYAGMHTIGGPYVSMKYLGPNGDDSTQGYYNSTDDLLYSRQRVIVGMKFEDGLTIDEKYTDLAIDIIPTMSANIERPKDENNTSYFPENTFEIVVALNPYGLLEDDATYGQSYTITKKLYDGQHNTVNIPLYDDLYGAEIYAIGIRAKDITTISDTSTTLTTGDMLGLGDLTLGSYNIRLYYPSDGRYMWKKGHGRQDGTSAQHSYAEVLQHIDEKGTFIYPLTEKIEATSDDKGFSTPIIDIGKKRSSDSCSNGAYGRPFTRTDIGSDKILVKEENMEYGDSKAYLQFPHMIFNFIDEPAPEIQDQPSFYIDTDFILDSYNWVRIEHYMEANPTTKTPDNYGVNGVYSLNGQNYQTQGQFATGDIVIEFYDTRDHENAGVAPIETFALPAWGRIQSRAYRENKTVNAWFKIRNGGRVKRVVIRRTGDVADDAIRLHVGDIAMHRVNSIPALGSQMQLKIYPESGATSENTRLRKVGVVYRIA